MALGLDLGPDRRDLALLVDQVRHAVRPHVLAAVHALLAPGAVSVHDRLVRVGEEREGQRELVGELAVRLLVVDRDAEDRDLAALQLRPRVAEGAGLLRAAGRVVLRIEVQDDFLALEVGELDGLPVLVLRRERAGPCRPPRAAPCESSLAARILTWECGRMFAARRVSRPKGGRRSAPRERSDLRDQARGRAISGEPRAGAKQIAGDSRSDGSCGCPCRRRGREPSRRSWTRRSERCGRAPTRWRRGACT